MRFLLDTNVVIGAGKADRRILARLVQYGEWQCAISTITVHELYFGAFKSDLVSENIEATRKTPFEVVDFDTNDAIIASEVRDRLRRNGTPIGPYDTLIAGQALARDLTLVTRNIREFERVEGLRVEDWER